MLDTMSQVADHQVKDVVGKRRLSLQQILPTFSAQREQYCPVGDASYGRQALGLVHQAQLTDRRPSSNIFHAAAIFKNGKEIAYDKEFAAVTR